jgi:hypothetical protein
MTNRLHIEVGIPPHIRSRVREEGARETVSGFGDFSLAAKYRLTSEDAAIQLALRPSVKLPTAKRSLGNAKVEGGIIVPIEYQFPNSELSVAFSPELDVLADSDGSGYHLAWAQVAGLAIPVSSRISVSAEVSTAWDRDPVGTVRQYAVAGSAAYLLSNDVQLDAGINLGLNRSTADLELYYGAAFRF